MVVLDKTKGEGTEASAIYLAINKYCEGTELTVILKDNGELVGEYAISLLNSMHNLHNVPLVISNYLLDLGIIYTNIDNDYRFRIELYPTYEDPSNPKQSKYKTKFIKSYRTSILRDLPSHLFLN